MEKLAKKFTDNILQELKKSLAIKNINAVPKVVKVVVSCGIGDFKEDDKMIEKITSDLAKITGQKPKLNRARKAVSSFKLRIGQPVGLTTTLRDEKMYDFIDRLVNAALPRVRDFRGLPVTAFDGQGNYSIGIKDHAIFPEIKYEDISKSFGFQINVKTTAKDNSDAKALLSMLGFPFEKKNKPAETIQAEGINPIKSSEAGSAQEDSGEERDLSAGDIEKEQENSSEAQTSNGVKEQNG